MADLGDVEQALAAVVVGALYPSGTSGPSIAGVQARVFRGWPTASLLTRDRCTSTVDVGITSISGSTRNTTRWGVQVSVLPGPAGLSVEVSGNSATFAGTAATGDLAGLLVQQIAYIYQAKGGESAELVAAALADLVREAQICWLRHSSVTVPGVSSIVARTSGFIRAVQEYGRQEVDFRIAIWAPSPAAREVAASAVIRQFAQVSFLTLEDGTAGRVTLQSIDNSDEDQAASIYRHDIIYRVEFGITVDCNQMTMLFGDLALNGVMSLS